jgi:acyl carrier protein
MGRLPLQMHSDPRLICDGAGRKDDLRSRFCNSNNNSTGQLSMSENESKLRAAFCEVLSIRADQVTDETSYRTTQSWDSIAHMALIAAIDTSFDLTMDTDDLLEMNSYGRAKEILRRYGINI